MWSQAPRSGETADREGCSRELLARPDHAVAVQILPDAQVGEPRVRSVTRRRRPSARALPDPRPWPRTCRGPTKKPVSVRLSARVLDHYRAQGRGWQTRLNADRESLIGKDRR
ncbi:MAG: BrnA antitoxin family protein [Caulobacteraceae bacterium]